MPALCAPTRGCRSLRACGHVLETFTAVAESILTREGSIELQESLEREVSGGKAYDLQGFDLLDFFYLGQRTRRWQSAHLAINLFDVALLQVVNVEHIKLAFAMNPADRAAAAFQTFIIRRNTESLLRVPAHQMLYTRFYHRLQGPIARASAIGGRSKHIDWRYHFRIRGPDYVAKVLARETPLELILDVKKEKEEGRWSRLGSRDWLFNARLVSFYYWHHHYVAHTPDHAHVLWG